MSYQATVPFYGVVRGDSRDPQNVRFVVDGTAVTPTSAAFNIKDVASIVCVCENDVVTIPKIAAATTETWTEGVHECDLRVVIDANTVTYLKGEITVYPSSSA
jgi:hypothetical protein